MFKTAKLILEAISLFGVTFVFFWHPSVRSFLAAHRRALLPWAVVAFFAFHAVAQFTTREQYRFPQAREPFPFTRWAMFAGMTHDISEAGIYEWQARLTDGTAVSLNPARLFVTPNAVVHFTKTHAIGDGLLSLDAATRREFRAHADAYARGLAKRFEALSGTSRVITVELWKRRFLVRIGAHVPEPFIAGDGCSLVYTAPISRP
jgi:hypothetical protein